MGANRAEIARVQALGYSGWIDQQMAMPASQSRWDWLRSKGMDSSEYRNSQAGFDSCAWKKLISSPRYFTSTHLFCPIRNFSSEHRGLGEWRWLESFCCGELS